MASPRMRIDPRLRARLPGELLPRSRGAQTAQIGRALRVAKARQTRRAAQRSGAAISNALLAVLASNRRGAAGPARSRGVQALIFYSILWRLSHRPRARARAFAHFVGHAIRVSRDVGAGCASDHDRECARHARQQRARAADDRGRAERAERGFAGGTAHGARACGPCRRRFGGVVREQRAGGAGRHKR